MMRHMNDRELEYTILTMVKMKCNLYSLRVANVPNDHIVKVLQQSINKGVLKQTAKGVVLIDESYWHKLGDQLGRRGLYRYVLPEYFYKQEKMNLEEIYIPLHIRKK